MFERLSGWASGAAASEPMLRAGLFLVAFGALAAAESAFPRSRRRLLRRERWSGNLLLAGTGAALTRALLPAGAVGFALGAEARGIGIFNRIAAPAWAEFGAALILLDLAIYFQHRIFHAVPALWRFHRVHHADPDLDATTGVRFHPGELLLSLGIKGGVILMLGASPAAVLSFEVLLNAASMFNHANLKVSSGADRALRALIVTPDMHRVHHSAAPAEMNRNFGFSFPWWDRIFGTYRAAPEHGYDEMTVGLAQFADAREEHLSRMLTQPFREGKA